MRKTPSKIIDMTKPVITATAASALALVLSLAPASQAEARDVKIGVILGFTGPIESLTPDMAASAELAMKEVSDSGKLLDGVKLVPVRADSTCTDSAAASAAAERLVTAEGVAAIYGADCSGVTTAVANNVAVPNGVVMISPSATSPALTTIEDKGYFFRTAPSDARQGQVLADAVMERGIKSVAVTAGYICEAPRAEFYRHMDAANIDLKAFTEGFYKQLCSGSLGAVLDTLVYLKQETQVWTEITTLLIPDENDSPAEIERLSAWVMDKLGPDVPLHFTAFHPDWKMLDKSRTPPETLLRACRIAREAGIRYVYSGNIHHPPSQTTHCHGCGQVLIRRDWHQILDYALSDDGHCRRCGTPCAGVFEGPAGSWGARRQALRLEGLAARMQAKAGDTEIL